MARIFLSRTIGDPSKYECEKAACPVPGCKYGSHERVWVIQRVLADTFGHFPVFNINGEKVPVDGSLPHKVATLPRDAQLVSPELTHAFWVDPSGSHTFGW